MELVRKMEANELTPTGAFQSNSEVHIHNRPSPPDPLSPNIRRPSDRTGCVTDPDFGGEGEQLKSHASAQRKH